MIITDKISIKIRKNNIEHYKKFDCKLGDILDVHPNDLISGSQFRIDVKCDICNIKYTISIYKYRENVKNHNGYYSCKKCSKIKRDKTCLERYGTEHPISLDKFKKKREDNNFQKYGVKNTLEIKEIRDNIKNTCVEKYGTDNPSKNKKIRNKTKNTCIEKYRSSSPLESIEILNKIKNTCIKKYGVDSALKSIETLNKIKQTRFDNPWKNNKVRDKIKETLFNRYGVNHPLQSQYIYNLMIKKSFIIKKYKNTNLYYQGTYELNFLNKYYDKLKIENGFTIKYKFDDIERVYYPDFYLPERKLIVEIKSTMWYNKHLNINLAKQKQCILNGYNFIFIIDKNYEEFEKLLNLTFFH